MISMAKCCLIILQRQICGPQYWFCCLCTAENSRIWRFWIINYCNVYLQVLFSNTFVMKDLKNIRGRSLVFLFPPPIFNIISSFQVSLVGSNRFRGKCFYKQINPLHLWIFVRCFQPTSNFLKAIFLSKWGNMFHLAWKIYNFFFSLGFVC